MGIAYGERITQRPSALVALERQLRGRPLADRIELLRVLKTRTVRSLRAAAPLLGSSERQVPRWWVPYTTAGLEALLSRRPRAGRQEQVRAEAWTALAVERQVGRVARLKEGQRSWHEQWGIDYHSLNGISQLLKRRKTKLQTGRRRHRQAHLVAQAAFKKYLRPPPRPAAGARRVGSGCGALWAPGLGPPPLVSAGHPAALGRRRPG
jgi:transposase